MGRGRFQEPCVSPGGCQTHSPEGCSLLTLGRQLVVPTSSQKQEKGSPSPSRVHPWRTNWGYQAGKLSVFRDKHMTDVNIPSKKYTRAKPIGPEPPGENKPHPEAFRSLLPPFKVFLLKQNSCAGEISPWATSLVPSLMGAGFTFL